LIEKFKSFYFLNLSQVYTSGIYLSFYSNTTERLRSGLVNGTSFYRLFHNFLKTSLYLNEREYFLPLRLSSENLLFKILFIELRFYTNNSNSKRHRIPLRSPTPPPKKDDQYMRQFISVYSKLS